MTMTMNRRFGGEGRGMTLRRATRVAATGVGTTNGGDDMIHLTTNPMAVAVGDVLAIARAIIIVAAMEAKSTRRSTAAVVAGVMTPTKKMMGVSTNVRVGNATTAVATTTTMAMVLSRRRMAKTVTTRPCQRAIRRDSRMLPNSAWRRPKDGP